MTSVESVPGTQKLFPSSSSSPPASWLPGVVQLAFASIARQFSKCPTSSDIATLYVWALHVFPRVFAVEYSGWKAYGASWQVVEFGVYRMWPNPLATEAVIEPACRVVRSIRLTWNPAGVSCMWMRILSPGFIIRSLVVSGFTAAKFGFAPVPVNSGLAGACDWPLRVT